MLFDSSKQVFCLYNTIGDIQSNQEIDFVRQIEECLARVY